MLRMPRNDSTHPILNDSLIDRTMAARFRGNPEDNSPVAVMESQSATASPAGILARVKALLFDSGEAAVTKRLAATIFIIRVVSAVMAYGAQILLARWMGTSEYGVYVYVWTWVLLLGSMMDFGISASAQKLIPEYRSRLRAS